jgi:cytochrome c oxidase subunit 2
MALGRASLASGAAGGWAGAALAAAPPSRPLFSYPMGYLSGFGSKAYPVVALTWGLLVLSVVVIAIIAGLVLIGARRRRSASAYGPIEKGEVLEEKGGLNWLVIGVGLSSIALIVSLVWTVAVLAQVNQPSGAEPFTIEVTGRQWWWDVRYVSAQPDRVFRTANEIHIPVGRPVRFELKSGDVIHSFWSPALGGKTDTIPGQTNVTWLEADQPGRYRGQCTEYCGFQHAHMALEVVADSPADFAAWWNGQVQGAQPNPAEGQGQALFVEKCGSCHAVRGTDAGGQVAPDLTHLMSRRWIAAGAVANTPAGLSGWIANPQAIKPGALMPTLYLSGPELAAVSGFLETLK